MPWKNTDADVIREYNRSYRESNKDRINQQDRLYWRSKYGVDGRSEDEPLASRQGQSNIRGPRPRLGEKAIYFLRSEEETPYYVGSTGNPVERMSGHRQENKRSGDMVIIRCCPSSEQVYWECKLLVEMFEAGHTLENLISPVRSK